MVMHFWRVGIHLGHLIGDIGNEYLVSMVA